MTSSAAKENSVTAYDPCGGAVRQGFSGGGGGGGRAESAPQKHARLQRVCWLYLRLTQAREGGWEKSLSGREGMYRTDREKSM